MKNAFTMVELVFVIVVIGILSAIAVPKFAATRDDAEITKAISTVAAVRNAISTERQKRILKGEFGDFTSLGGSTGIDKILFDYFDGNTSGSRVLEYGIRSCKTSTSKGCWTKSDNTTYVYTMPTSGRTVTFTFDKKSRFTCSTSSDDCKILSE